jgi:TrmH family RNA methyltransferase
MLVKSKIKYIQSLGQKKLRDELGVFVAEGPKIIKEFLAAENVKPVNIFATRNWIETTAAFRGGFSLDEIIEVTDQELERISFLQSPNQVLGVFEKPVFDAGFGEGGLVLLLDEIQDPGNLGTIIRTADWFGIKKMLCSSNGTDAFNPKVVQSSMGSLARVRVIYEDLESFLTNNSGIPVYATTLDGENIFDSKKISRAFILIGNESKGISESLLRLSTQRVTIPKWGDAESLNAATAAGIVMAVLRGSQP